MSSNLQKLSVQCSEVEWNGVREMERRLTRLPQPAWLETAQGSVISSGGSR